MPLSPTTYKDCPLLSRSSALPLSICCSLLPPTQTLQTSEVTPIAPQHLLSSLTLTPRVTRPLRGKGRRGDFFPEQPQSDKVPTNLAITVNTHLLSCHPLFPLSRQVKSLGQLHLKYVSKVYLVSYILYRSKLHKSHRLLNVVFPSS